jgi:hypothetical protein
MKKSKRIKLPKRDPKQAAFDFVERCEDLPIFSGTAPRVAESTFKPKPAPRQPNLFGRPKLEDLQKKK